MTVHRNLILVYRSLVIKILSIFNLVEINFQFL